MYYGRNIGELVKLRYAGGDFRSARKGEWLKLYAGKRIDLRTLTLVWRDVFDKLVSRTLNYITGLLFLDAVVSDELHSFKKLFIGKLRKVAIIARNDFKFRRLPKFYDFVLEPF